MKLGALADLERREARSLQSGRLEFERLALYSTEGAVEDWRRLAVFRLGG